MSRRPSAHELEERLRAEARLARRPAPPGLLARARAAAGSVEAPPPAALSPAAAPRSRVRPFLGLAAAVLAVAALRSVLPPGLNGTPVPRGEPMAELREATALLSEPRISANVEHPLLQELELLGQDTARAAAALVRDLPGPLGDVFGPR